MKKGMILVLGIIYILSITSVSALITIDSNFKTNYNLGDQIAINGSVILDESQDLLLKISKVCGNESQTIVLKSFNIIKNGPKKFGEQTKILEFGKSCFFNFELEDFTGFVIDSLKTKSFNATKQLEGDFRLEKNKIQLGDSIKITGSVYKMNGNPAEGYGIIAFNQENRTILTDNFEIVSGKVNYEKQASELPAGESSITIGVFDSYGNYLLYNDLSNLLIVNDITLTSYIVKDILLPGEDLKIEGDAKLTLTNEFDGADVRISFLDIFKEYYLDKKNFNYKIELPENIKSGLHNVTVKISDEFGNKAEVLLPLTIEPIPTELIYELNQTSYSPGSKILLSPALMDQAGDLISGWMVNVKLEDGKMLSHEVSSGSNVYVNIPLNMAPGEYELEINYGNVKKLQTIVVEELKKAVAVIEENVITLFNQGNVEYTEKVTFYFDKIGGDGSEITGYSINDLELGLKETNNFIVLKNIDLVPLQNFSLNFENDVPAGDYNIKFELDGQEYNFDNVNIGGKGIKSLNWVVWILWLTALGLIGVIAYLEYDNLQKELKKPALKKKSSRIIKNEGKKGIFNLSKEEEIKDFKDRVLKEVNNMTEKHGSSLYRNKEYQSNQEQKPKEPANPFSMLD